MPSMEETSRTVLDRIDRRILDLLQREVEEKAWLVKTEPSAWLRSAAESWIPREAKPR